MLYPIPSYCLYRLLSITFVLHTFELLQLLFGACRRNIPGTVLAFEHNLDFELRDVVVTPGNEGRNEDVDQRPDPSDLYTRFGTEQPSLTNEEAANAWCLFQQTRPFLNCLI